MARYPKKSGRCEIKGCKNTPTDWHHVISQAQIKKRGLPKSFYTDRGNLKEFCREHHDMTTASMTRKYLEGKDKPKTKPKPKAKPKPKKKGRKTPNYDVICARCNRVGHESKDCRAKTKVNPTGPLADLMRKGKPKR